MKINSLKLRGFVGVKKGLGLDEIELNLSGLSGLIALSGQNGAGKTSILESLQPYRTLASRSKALQHHVFMRDACKELDFDFQGDNYKTKVLIDCDSGRQEGYIWKNGASEINGKVRNYDAYIEDLFGSKDLFFNSIFCAQNASKLSDLTTGKLKELFSEFLRLDQYVAHEATTKQCLVILGSQASVYDRQVERIQESVRLLIGVDEQLEGAINAKTEQTALITQIEHSIVSMASRIVTTGEIIAVNAIMEDRAEDFRGRIKASEAGIENASDEYNARVDGLRGKLRKVKADISTFDKTLEMRDEIEAATSRKTELNEKIINQTTAIERCQSDLYAIREKIHQHDQTIPPSTKPHKRENDIPLLKLQIQNAESKAQDLEKRDPDCTSKTCSFIEGALQAQGSVEGLRAELKAVGWEVAEHDRKVETILKEAAGAKAEMQGIEDEISRTVKILQKRLSASKVEYDECARRAARHDDLRVAIAQKKTAQARAEELTAQGMKEKTVFDVRNDNLWAELDKMRASLDEIMAKIDSSAKGTLTALEITHEDKLAEKKGIMEQVDALSSDIQQYQREIEQRNAYRKQESELNLKQASIQTQIKEWTYLRDALSKDGLRALEIDAVAPSISAYANQILFNTFGPAYSVKLRTQDDEGREVLDILAIEEDGKETLLEDLSGGEKVWSLKALRLAMTLIAKQKSARQFLSALADEEDGALDAGNAQNFIHLYRSFMDAGGFEDCYFISHRPECIAMADHVLEFGNGGVSIN